ncbi:MAG TPA: polysaccharide deacetylase family protein [Nitrospiraceae bacterium]|jgi:peptidoglycan/xylan/chitin deacetylase (PgdA/CDA1 family)|nr:polysaccharide deacetylase family protein [Nitrospiraceae bacterium]
MLKTLMKNGVAAALGWTGTDRAVASWTGTKALPLVLAYHGVVEDVHARPGLAKNPNLISLNMLESQLDWIGRRYRFINLDELGARLEHGDPFGQPSAAVTFDDGYAGVYHLALPLLKQKGIPAGMFIVTEATGSPELQIYDKTYLLLEKVLPLFGHSEERFQRFLGANDIHIGAYNGGGRLDDAFRTMRWLFTTLPQKTLRRVIEALETVCRIDPGDYPEMQTLDWEMVRTIADSGMTIGSHTQTHALLTEESDDQVTSQTVESRFTLRDKLNRPIAHFAYPDGRFNAAVVSAVAKAGYRFGYGTCLRRDRRHPGLTIPRTLLWERSCVDGAGQFSAALMSCHANRLYDLWSPCAHDHNGRAAASTPKDDRAIGEDISNPPPRQSERHGDSHDV